MFQPLANIWRCHVLSVEYPTYGVYKNRELSESSIIEDSNDVYHFLTTQAHLKADQIIVFGRSMGSGCACSLASKKPIAGLILFSAYKSVKEAAKSVVGGFLGAFVNERFSSIRNITKIDCPVQMIHGKKDTVIPYEHSVELYQKCISQRKKILLPETMTHNDFDLDDDLIEPVSKFLVENNLHTTVPGQEIDPAFFYSLRLI